MGLDHVPENVLFLPGMGADERMFSEQMRVIPGSRCLRWIPPEKKESLSDYVVRLARHHRIPEEPYLIGSSFGGIAAQELAVPLRAKAVILIGSAKSAEVFPGILKLVEKTLRILPDRLFRSAMLNNPFLKTMFGVRNAEDERLFRDMLQDAAMPFLRWAPQAVLNWKPSELPCPILQIHGDRDRMIPPKRTRPDRWVRGGGHFISVTHASQVTSFLLDILR